VPTTTVIIPAYQAAATLPAALASVAAQSHPADEVIVLDDASGDATAAVAEAWRDRLPLTVIRKDVNGGLGAARRDAIAASRGTLVALLDADDYWLPDHLEVLLARHREVGGIVAASGVRWVPGQVLGTTPWHELMAVPAPEDQPRTILSRNFLLSSVLIERAAYDEAGGFADLRCDEDWDLWIRMIRQGQRVSVAPTVTVVFRNRPESLSSGESYLPADIELLERLAGSLDDPAERRVVRRALDRRRARVALLEGYDHARHGRAGQARRVWLRAAATDRSLSGGLGNSGSVTLRALLCAVAPARVVAHRDRRSQREARHG
jgi:glycosyltransferase involved in cell wall biosynthesis